jgi:hypothetical protein
MRESKMTLGFAMLLLTFMTAIEFPIPTKSKVYQTLQAEDAAMVRGGLGGGGGQNYLSTFKRVYIIYGGEYTPKQHTLYNTVY